MFIIQSFLHDGHVTLMMFIGGGLVVDLSFCLLLIAEKFKPNFQRELGGKVIAVFGLLGAAIGAIGLGGLVYILIQWFLS